MQAAGTASSSSTKKTTKEAKSTPSCGLCGKTEQLIKTSCCDNWICNDSHKYVPFSYARNSCYRNHNYSTLCGYHHNEGHSGNWKTCEECRGDFDTEDYVEFATSNYNFEKLKNPPTYEATSCADCGKVIIRANGGYSLVFRKGDREPKFVCGPCSLAN